VLSSWLLFPAALIAVSAGCALALERLAGVRLPGPALVPAGAAVVVVVAQIATASAATAELAAPLAVGVAGVGLLVGWRRLLGIEPWAVLAGAIPFAAFAAPVVLSGAPTWAGYTVLDDTATWFALVDRVMEHGRDIAVLEASTYEATLDFNLADGYPVGSLLPLGLGAALAGEDVAWVFQPYLATLAAALGLGLYSLAGGLVASRPLRAGVAAIAAQAALLYGYALWGGVKEVAAAVLLVGLGALLATMVADRRARAALPAAVAVAAVISTLSPGGAIVWALPVALIAAVAAAAGRGGALRVRQWVALGAIAGALVLPWIGEVGFLPPTSAPLTSEVAQGNLAEPLDPLQGAGVWPAGDFRTDPRAPALTAGLAVVVLLAAALALALAWRRRALGILAYGAGAVAATAATVIVASPWVGAKALAIGSPAALGLGLAALAALVELRGAGGSPRPGRLAVAALAGAAIAATVVWSNALAYREVRLAPAERYAELERVAEVVAGTGPTLLPEYDPYGARHFLRDSAPESVSDLRRRRIPLRGGGVVRKGRSADLDELAIGPLLGYRNIVLRRSPLASRPPALYRLSWRGRHYEVWTRTGDAGRLLSHQPLGRARLPAATPRCTDVIRAARRAGPRGRIAGVRHPDLRTAGRGDDGFQIPDPGRYVLWLAGSVPDRVAILVDGEAVGETSHELNHRGHLIRIGVAELEPGARVDVVREEPPLAPGAGAPKEPLGPLVVAPAGRDPERTIVASSGARRLCGLRLDWVEALGRR